MPFNAAPTRDSLAGTGAAAPNNAQARTGLGALWDWATSLLGATGDPADARTALDVFSKSEVQSLIGQDYKTSVRFTTTGNITLSGLGTQAGGDWGSALTAGDRILPKDQTTGSQNGIYIAAAGAWTRATDADGVGELTSGAIVAVEEGTTLADSQWMLTTDGTITIGTTPLTFTRKDSSTSAVIRSYLSGLALSTAGSSATMSIAAGQAVDSTNTVLMSLAASISKTTGAWAVGTGNGGLDTGAIANNTWYHWYLIRRPDTGVVDVIFSTSASTPTLPTNYTQYRRIGSGRTNGSGQWVKFYQDGNEFLWDAPVADVSTSLSSASASYTLTVPTGVRVKALAEFRSSWSGPNQSYLWARSPDITDQSASATLSSIGINGNGSTVGGSAAQIYVQTNNSAQVRVSGDGSGGNSLQITTFGWVDSRGRDA